MKKKLIFFAAALLPLVAAAAVFFVTRTQEMKNAPNPRTCASGYLDGELATSAVGKLAVFRAYTLDGDYSVQYRRAQFTGMAEYVDTAKLADGLGVEVNAKLAEYLDAAVYASEIYNEDMSFSTDCVARAYDECLAARLADDSCLVRGALTVELSYDGERWSVTDLALPFAMEDEGETERALYAAATADLTYIKKHYRIPEDAVAAPAPGESCFGSTVDPAVIEALLATDEAKALMNGQQSAFNSSLDFIPGRLLRYYLDETILVLQWQEVTAKAVGTFSEVFVADASQLRRKLAGDICCGYDFEYPTELARQANAVLAVGGDLYNHARACGIVVYQREIYRFEPNTCDTCYITTDGNMLYSKAGQFTDIGQAQKFIADNDVLFSLCFGPVLIEDGADVTPDTYPWGEINDTYARSALGMLGGRHYLTMNINCEWNDYYYLATLRQATDAMLAHGCITAYALDGGQTACTVLNGELINVVQFNTEKITSDIVYFATALPEAG